MMNSDVVVGPTYEQNAADKIVKDAVVGVVVVDCYDVFGYL